MGIQQAALMAAGDSVTLSNHSQTAGPGSSARFRLTNAGVAEGSNNGGANWTSYAPEWLVPGANSGNYECEAIVTSGVLSSGPSGSGVWTSLASTQTWIRNTPGGGSATVIFTLSIRRAGTGTVLASAQITLVGAN